MWVLVLHWWWFLLTFPCFMLFHIFLSVTGCFMFVHINIHTVIFTTTVSIDLLNTKYGAVVGNNGAV